MVKSVAYKNCTFDKSKKSYQDMRDGKRCFKCSELGHIAKFCPLKLAVKPPRPRPQQPRKDSERKGTPDAPPKKVVVVKPPVKKQVGRNK